MKRLEKIIYYLTLIFIVLMAILFFLKPIQDYDFWWHLRTGQYIIETKGLPDKDPFTYTAIGEPTQREKFILKSYWLSQIFLYLSYHIDGFNGVVILRFFLLNLMFIVLYKRLREECQDRVLIPFLILLSLIIFGTLYHADRPFILSFLYASVLLWLLDNIKCGKRNGFYLSAIMLLWANSHGGFILGDVIILFYILSEGIKFLIPSFRSIDKKAFSYLCLWGIIGIFFSFINPNSYKVIPVLFEIYKSNLVAYNLEYKSSLYFFTHVRGGYTIVFYWLMLILSLIGFIVNRKKIDITDMVIVLLLGILSFFEIRNIGFFIFASGPIIVRYLRMNMETLRTKMQSFGLIAASFVLIISILSIKIPLSVVGIPNFRQWINPMDFPFKAADFIEKADITGNMYNAYEWGGFLIWRFYPERKVFIDGRGLNEDIYFHSLSIEKGDVRNFFGFPKWRALLNVYGVEIILIPLLERSGNIHPLVSRLLNDDEWQIVYYYHNSLVFVRDIEKNREVIDKYAIPKWMVLSDEFLRRQGN